MKTIPIILCFLCCLFPHGVKADQFDPDLRKLFLQLQNTRSAMIIKQVQANIWQTWTHHENAEANTLMIQGIQKMNQNAFVDALDDFNQLITLAPKFSEAWNKRATIYYLLKNYQASKEDIEQTLLLEPKHFGALSGLGLILMAEEEFLLARIAFNSALEINPSMPSVKNNLEAIDNYLNDIAI